MIAAAALWACGSGASGEDGGVAPTAPDPEDDAVAAAPVDVDVDRVDSVRYLLDDRTILAAIVESAAGGITATKVDDGYRLDGIGVGGVLLRFGLIDGDVVTAVDGVALAGPLAVREAYAGLGDATSIDVTLERAGKRVERRYYVRDHLGDALPPSAVFSDQQEPLASYTALLDGLRGGVRVVAPDRVEVGLAVAEVLADSPDLLDAARTVGQAARHRGRTPRPGVRPGPDTTMFVGAEPSVFTVLGLTPWDEITAVDGEGFLGTFDLGMSVVERLGTGGFSISVRRLGEPLVIRYEEVSGRADEVALRRLALDWRAERAANEPDFDDPFAGAGAGLGAGAAAAIDFAAGIEKLADTRYRIDPATWAALARDPASVVMSGSLIYPEMRGSDVIGLRVASVAPGSLHAAMGFEDGDIVTAIAGVSLEDFDQGDSVMDLMQALSDATEFEVAFERGGAARTHTYEIRGP